MAGTVTTPTAAFVMGREVDGNREMHVYTQGQEYNLDAEDIKAYSADETEFPVLS